MMSYSGEGYHEVTTKDDKLFYRKGLNDNVVGMIWSLKRSLNYRPTILNWSEQHFDYPQMVMINESQYWRDWWCHHQRHQSRFFDEKGAGAAPKPVRSPEYTSIKNHVVEAQAESYLSLSVYDLDLGGKNNPSNVAVKMTQLITINMGRWLYRNMWTWTEKEWACWNLRKVWMNWI